MNSLADVMPSVFALLGGPGDDRIGLAERLGSPRRVVVLLVDGLGYHLVPAAGQWSALLADAAAGRIGSLAELQSGLPSTTPVSLASLATGVPAGEHGIVGFTVRVPGTDRVLTHIRWRDDPPVSTWAPMPTLFSRAAAAGVTSAAVLPAEFAGTGLTRAVYGGARFVALSRGDDPVAALVSADADVVLGYSSAVDTAMHLHGLTSPQWGAAVARAGRLIERLRAALPADTALLVTADHGGLDVPASSRLDLADNVDLRSGVRIVAGEPRFRYLHTADGAAADVHAVWTEVLGHRADVLTRDELIDSGLLGTVRAEFAPRIGDLVAICRDDFAIFAREHEPKEVSALIGLHGARTDVETAVPLLALPG